MSDPVMLPAVVMLLAVASAWDAAVRRVPNAVIVGIAASGALEQMMRGGVTSLAWSTLAVLVVGALVWPAWARGWIGGGDLKLAAAAAAWLGIAHVPYYLLVSAVAIGAVAVVSYAQSSRAARREVRRNLALAAGGTAPAIECCPGRVQVPAGIGFAIAALVTTAVKGMP